jgi:hypothetical protein
MIIFAANNQQFHKEIRLLPDGIASKHGVDDKIDFM